VLANDGRLLSHEAKIASAEWRDEAGEVSEQQE
jgi:hypothetical protein